MELDGVTDFYADIRARLQQIIASMAQIETRLVDVDARVTHIEKRQNHFDTQINMVNNYLSTISANMHNTQREVRDMQRIDILAHERVIKMLETMRKDFAGIFQTMSLAIKHAGKEDPHDG